MTAQTITRIEANTAVEEAQKNRQYTAVMNHLMKTAFGNTQVYHRVRANTNFRAGLQAIDPGLPGFIEDEDLRDIIQTGCLYLIDLTAILLKLTREGKI
jgi:hypothetical protein